MRAHPLQTTASHRGAAFARNRDIDGPGRRSGHPARPGQLTGPVRVPERTKQLQPVVVSTAALKSILICDDRADVRRELSRLVRLRSRDRVQDVSAGDALLKAYEARSAQQVLIGIHSGSTFGMDAFTLLVTTHPTAAPIVFGSINDIDLLARVYDLGAGGLMLWEAGSPLS